MRYVPLDAMEISYTNTRVHTLHVDSVQPSLVAEATNLTVYRPVFYVATVSHIQECNYHLRQPCMRLVLQGTSTLNTHWRFCMFQNFDSYTLSFLHWNDADVIYTLGSR